MSITAVICQARMGSTRLPGKVMKPLAGRTVLAHVMTRCLAVAGINVVCCATTCLSEDDVVAAEAERQGVEVFRGSEHDVLDRYVKAARRLGADVILRVTCDCPLIDPDVCDRVIRLRAEKQADYASNVAIPSWPHGLDCEAFTREVLERANVEAATQFEREHVTTWMHKNSDLTRCDLPGPGGEAAKQRWTLDYPEDYAFLLALFELIPPPPDILAWQEVLALIQARPEIAEINRDRAVARPGCDNEGAVLVGRGQGRPSSGKNAK